jgi:hypothetical protein
MGTMTKRLAEAVAQARGLPDEKQDELADALFAHMAERDGMSLLSREQVDEVRRIQEGLRTGTTRLATDEEVAETWKQFGG